MADFFRRIFSSKAAVDAIRWWIQLVTPGVVAWIVAKNWNWYLTQPTVVQVSSMIIALLVILTVSVALVWVLQWHTRNIAMQGVPELEQDRIDGAHLVDYLKDKQKESAVCSVDTKERVYEWIQETEEHVSKFAPNENRMYRTLRDNLDYRQGETQPISLIPIVEMRIEKIRRIIGRKEAQAYDV